MRKIIALMFIVALSLNAIAATCTIDGYTWSYTVTNGNATITGVSPQEGVNLAIPGVVDGYTVTSIGDEAFSKCSGFTGSLTIPDSVTSIGTDAFLGCSGFTGSLTIPDGVTSIGGGAFAECSGFTGSLTIPNGVTSIDGWTFTGCTGLTGALKLPDNLTNIGSDAFYCCSNFTGTLTIPNSVTRISFGAFYGCAGFAGELKLPEGLVYIGDWSFKATCFTGVLKIPDSVREICAKAFESCTGFTGVEISENVTAIGAYAFNGCSGVTNVVISANLTEIGSSMFYGIGLASVEISQSVCDNFVKIFDPNSIVDIRLQPGVSRINARAFSRCHSLKSVTIPDSVTSIGAYSFQVDSDMEIAFEGAPPSGVQNLGLEHAKCVYFPRKYLEQWRLYVTVNGQCSESPRVEVLSTNVREEDPTILDVKYIVRSSNSMTKVRVLAFKDGIRSFANVVKPETFVDGTAVNVGDSVAANEVLKLSWKVSADLGLDLAKLSFEVLAHEGDPLCMDWITIPASNTYGKMRVSYNTLYTDDVFDALMWLYADGDSGLTLLNGTLMNGSSTVATGTSIDFIGGPQYLFSKMGCSLLTGDVLTYVNEETRKNLSPSGIRQYAYKIVEE